MSNFNGEVHRLKAWTSYQPKRPRTVPGMLSEGFKTKPGMHTVVIVVGAIEEDQLLTQERVEEMILDLGWKPK